MIVFTEKTGICRDCREDLHMGDTRSRFSKHGLVTPLGVEAARIYLILRHAVREADDSDSGWCHVSLDIERI